MVKSSGDRANPHLFCALCVPEHSGHDVALLAVAALASRGRIAKLLYDLPATHAASAAACQADSAPASAASELVPHPVVAAREVARSLDSSLAAVSVFAEAALAHVSSTKDALISAIADRATLISEQIKLAASAKEAAIRDELAHADAVLSRVSSETEVLSRALGASGLCDADILAHEKSLTSATRVCADAAATLKARPRTNPLLEIRPVGGQVLTNLAVAAHGLQAHIDAAEKALGELFVSE